MQLLLLRLLDRRYAPPPAAGRADWLLDGAYAHRGLHDGNVAENSLGAFRAAASAGLGIECDIRKSSDGRAVVFHDEGLERLTGATGALHEHTIGQLTAIRLRKGGETIPTLRDALDSAAGKVPLLLEIKTRGQRPVWPICRAVRHELEGYVGQVAIMSFDPKVSAWFAKRAPHIVRGLVISEEDARTFSGSMRRTIALWKSRPDFLAYDIRDLPSRFAARHQKRGLPLLTWTVRSKEQLALARSCGAAAIAEGPIAVGAVP